MSTQAPVETEVVSGQVVGVITKPNDKWQIEISTGGQYTRRLWTKDAGLVNQMSAAVGQSFDFVCGVSHWQGQTGPVRSLWVNSVAMFGSTPAQQGQAYQQPQGQTAPPQQQQPVTQQPVTQQPVQGLPTLSPMEKDMRIMREHAMGVAATMLPYMKPEERNFLGMVNVAEGLIRYYQQGPPPNGQPQPEQQPLPAQPEPSQPHPDDDIPF